MARSFAALACLAGCTLSPRAPAPPEGCDAVASIVAALHAHPVVMLGEQHRRREDHALLQALVRDPRLAGSVDDIVVEFGSAREQPVLDRYLAGEAVPQDALRRVWRDTTQIVTWDSPVYADFFRAVREVNGHGAHLRVLLGDPPIDWANVQGKDDYARYADRDGFFASVVEQQVLANHRRALVIIGGEHVARTAPSEPAARHPGVGDILMAHHVDAFAIMPVPPNHVPPGMPACIPAIVPATGALGAASFGTMSEPNVMVQRIVDGKPTWVKRDTTDWPAIRDKVDALLWLGATSSEVASPPAEGDYLRELHRRAQIMSDFYGFDLTADLPPLP